MQLFRFWASYATDNLFLTVASDVTWYGRYGTNAACIIGKSENGINGMQPNHVGSSSDYTSL